MPKAKIRFALVPISYEDAKGNTLSRNYFRGDVVPDISEEEYERLAAMGAVVPADTELERPGALMALPDSPSDEELLAWVANASEGEIAQLALDRAHMVERIQGARTVAKANYKRQMEMLGRAEAVSVEAAKRVPQRLPGSDAFIGTPDTAAIGGIHTESASTGPADGGDHALEGGIVSGENEEAAQGAATPEGGTPGATDTPQVDGGPEKVEVSSEIDDLVNNNVDVVTDYISRHPENAAAVLDAEVRRTNGHPRQTVVRSVEAAAGHTQ